ncbi:MAG: GNAT family N-acetyltransferase [Acidimicrobiia bacterium]|nr:GNAT family N-acetyltransferase [Acidimicrobiia bacterium]
MTEHIRHLELVGHATWPSLEDEWLNGWLLRAGGGVTRRANSVSPVYERDIDLDRQVARCEAWFEQRGLAPVFRLTQIADPAIDDCLDGRGYEHDLGAAIMTRPIAGFLDTDVSEVSVISTPTERWLDVMGRERGRGGAKRGALQNLLNRIEAPAGFASIELNGRLAAIGLGVVAGSYVALFMMRTEEEQRRRGLAKAVAVALARWGSDHGAAEAFLQVHPSNAPAIALYRSLGFERRYEYWYRQ